MSRGPGRMQRLILNNLEAAKKEHAVGGLDYQGAAWGETCLRIAFGEKPVVMESRRLVELPPGVYDLRAVAAYLAHRTGSTRKVKGNQAKGRGYLIDPGFQASFSRAVRSLLRRELLVPAHPRHPPRFVTAKPGLERV
jgi:hypothetical protein